MADKPADVDPAEFPRDGDATAIDSAGFVAAVEDAAFGLPDAVPLPVADDAKTPRPDVTGRHSTLTPAQFATAIDLTDRDAFARGVEHGRAAAIADAEAAAMTELRRVREDGVEAFRSFYVMWEGAWPATWEEAEAWYRGRLTPL